ncbi:MAG: class I SAM-dependent methyltransferase [bacterium]|nr:class I SAM-dependent methyltransferase [bacterium]
MTGTGTKNTEWLEADAKELDYHIRQYEKPKEYTRTIINYFRQWGLNKSGARVLDLGCGAGANCYHLAKAYPRMEFTGVDINPANIELAGKHKTSNTGYTCGDIMELEIRPGDYEGILSIQTLSWMPNYEDTLERALKGAPQWILITSLFYDGPVETEIVVKDYSRQMGDKDHRRSYYNIYSLDRVKQYLKKYGYEMTRAEPFIFPFDLPEPPDKGMGTYTITLSNNQRLQKSGPLLMPWYTLLIEKTVVG